MASEPTPPERTTAKAPSASGPVDVTRLCEHDRLPQFSIAVQARTNPATGSVATVRETRALAATGADGFIRALVDGSSGQLELAYLHFDHCVTYEIDHQADDVERQKKVSERRRRRVRNRRPVPVPEGFRAAWNAYGAAHGWQIGPFGDDLGHPDRYPVLTAQGAVVGDLLVVEMTTRIHDENYVLTGLQVRWCAEITGIQADSGDPHPIPAFSWGFRCVDAGEDPVSHSIHEIDEMVALYRKTGPAAPGAAEESR